MTHSPGDLPHEFAKRFNAGDATALYQLYEPDALLLGPLEEHLALRKQLEVSPRDVLVCGDLALLIVDWRIAGTDIEATGTDVARRGPDGHWRYVIDNPFGIDRG